MFLVILGILVFAHFLAAIIFGVSTHRLVENQYGWVEVKSVKGKKLELIGDSIAVVGAICSIFIVIYFFSGRLPYDVSVSRISAAFKLFGIFLLSIMVAIVVSGVFDRVAGAVENWYHDKAKGINDDRAKR